jgi:phosphotransacetylase
VTSINLSNLAKIGLLEPVALTVDQVNRMLAAAKQRLKDAEFIQNSAETRFDCAFTTIRAVADVGLHLQGFRTSTSKPGHHQTAVQCLAHTLDVPANVVRVLDGLRKQRNLADYDGDLVTDAALAECLAQARAMLHRVEEVLKKHMAIGGAKG